MPADLRKRHSARLTAGTLSAIRARGSCAASSTDSHVQARTARQTRRQKRHGRRMHGRCERRRGDHQARSSRAPRDAQAHNRHSGVHRDLLAWPAISGRGVAETIMTSAPASAARAIVPPAQNASSSGCAKTPGKRRAEPGAFSTMTSSEPRGGSAALPGCQAGGADHAIPVGHLDEGQEPLHVVDVGGQADRCAKRPAAGQAEQAEVLIHRAGGSP